MAGTVLVVAAHPDDEILGCGGTVARHAAAGDRVVVVVVSEGAVSRGGDDAGREAEELVQAARRAAKVLGTEAPRLLGLPDNRLDSQDLLDVVRAIETVVREVAPDTVYTHHGSDLNIDHRIVHQAVLTACRPIPGSSVRRMYTFETVSSTEWSSRAIGPSFAPTRFVDISATLEAKRRALACYQREMRPFPHARSIETIEALARSRGSQTGLTAAEAFETIFDIQD